MSAPPEIVAFHLGIVVRSIEAVTDRYGRMFGIDRWQERPPMEGVQARVVYGGREGLGIALELIEPYPGSGGQMSEFLGSRGEGVQHIGLWTPDLRASLQAAVDEGGRLVAGPYEVRGGTVVQVEVPPGAPPPRQLAFIDPGAATMRFELVGPPADEGLRAWLRDYEVIINKPPWQAQR
ncbi:MAG TPA: VOC family protein [Dehalococcoidia bacterium]|nr:VOC family protein [Dehalococcoidia bacterium]